MKDREPLQSSFYQAEKRAKEKTFTPLTSGAFPGGWTMANPGPDADSTVLAIRQADGLAVRDARPVPVSPSSSLADKQGLRAPVRQCKARFTSSLSMTDGYWLLITLATKTFRIESPCIQRQDGTSVSDCLQELLAAGYSLLIAHCFLLSESWKKSHLQKRCRMVSSARDRPPPFVAFSAVAADDLHLLVQTPASSARKQDGFKPSTDNEAP